MAGNVLLRDVAASDFALFLENQRDPVARSIAAFGTKDPNPEAYAARWARAREDVSTLQQESSSGERSSASSPASSMPPRRTSPTGYPRHWGKGIATNALAGLVALIPRRPLHASAARDNVGSRRVLEKCGFVVTGTEKAFAAARGEEIDEVFFE